MPEEGLVEPATPLRRQKLATPDRTEMESRIVATRMMRIKAAVEAQLSMTLRSA